MILKIAASLLIILTPVGIGSAYMSCEVPDSKVWRRMCTYSSALIATLLLGLLLWTVWGL